MYSSVHWTVVKSRYQNKAVMFIWSPCTYLSIRVYLSIRTRIENNYGLQTGKIDGGRGIPGSDPDYLNAETDLALSKIDPDSGLSVIYCLDNNKKLIIWIRMKNGFEPDPDPLNPITFTGADLLRIKSLFLLS